MAKQKEEQKRKETQIWREYQDGVAFLNQKGLSDLLPKYNDFYYGKQWSEAGENTKNYPRLVINVTQQIIDNQAASLAEPIKMEFIADKDEGATQIMTQFTEYILNEMNFDKKQLEMIYSGLKKGTYVAHLFWDNRDVGKKGKVKGALRMSVLDPLNVLVHDPTETDVQKQQWVILVDKYSYDTVKEMAEEKYRPFVEKEINQNEFDKPLEQDNSNLVTVLTKYFRMNGEVYYQKATRTTNLCDPTPLNFNITAEAIKNAVKKLKEEHKDEDVEGIDYIEKVFADSQFSETPSQLEKPEANIVKFPYYPIEIGSFDPNDDCIYGHSAIDNIKEVQRAINASASFAVMNQQYYAFPKWLVKKGALKNQRITNDIGQVLEDNTPVGQWGVSTVEPAQLTAESLQLAPQLCDILRTVTKTSDLITSDTVPNDVSGTAMSLMIGEAEKTNSIKKQYLYNSIKRIGLILLEFFRLYYDEEEYSYELTQKEIETAQQLGQPYQANATGVFKGNDFEDIGFAINIEVGSGSQYSEAQTLSVLNGLLQQQLIDVKTYIKALSIKVLPHKKQILDDIIAREQSELMQLRQQVAQQQNDLQQLADYNKELEGNRKELYSALQNSNSVNKQMENEFTKKINDANKVINELSQKYIEAISGKKEDKNKKETKKK